MNQEAIPPEINTVLAGESYDFAVKADHKFPLSYLFKFFGIGGGFVFLSGVFVAITWVPILMGKEVHFKVGDVPTVAGPGNVGPLVTPSVLIGVFALVGLALLAYAFYSLFAKGAWNIGTPTRLIVYQKNRVRSIDWEQFSGDIDIRGTSEDGSIILALRTGKMVSQRRGMPDRFVPDLIYMTGIRNAFQIEPLLRKRIKENDPTPVNKAS